nr:MAG TPA: hypothetical protein [Caudoviricetes sp.]
MLMGVYHKQRYVKQKQIKLRRKNKCQITNLH